MPLAPLTDKFGVNDRMQSVVDHVRAQARAQGEDVPEEHIRAIAEKIMNDPGFGVEAPPEMKAPEAPSYNQTEEYDQANAKYKDALDKIKARRNASNLGAAFSSRWEDRVTPNEAKYQGRMKEAEDETLGEYRRNEAAKALEQKKADDETARQVATEERTRKGVLAGREDEKYTREQQELKDASDPNSNLSRIAREGVLEYARQAGMPAPKVDGMSKKDIAEWYPSYLKGAEAAIEREKNKFDQDYKNKSLQNQAEGLAIQRLNATTKAEGPKEVGWRKANEEYGKDFGEGKIKQIIDTKKADVKDLKEVETLIRSGKLNPDSVAALADAYARSKDNPGLIHQVLMRYASSPGIQTANAIFSRLAPRQRVAGSGSSSNLDVQMFFNGLGASISDPAAMLERVSSIRGDLETTLDGDLYRRDYFNEKGELPRSERPTPASSEAPRAPTSPQPQTGGATSKWSKYKGTK